MTQPTTNHELLQSYIEAYPCLENEKTIDFKYCANDINEILCDIQSRLIEPMEYAVGNYCQFSEDENKWYKSKFKNKEVLPALDCINTPEPLHKKLIELLFAEKFGNWIDNKLLHITLKHWRKKYPEMNHEDFDLQFRSKKHVCKYHSKGHQNKVLTIWQEKIKIFERKFDVELNSH